MKYLISILLITLTAVSLDAQPKIADEVREKIESMRIAAITSSLDLSPKESEKFWPLYNQFNKERESIADNMKGERINEDMSDEELTQAMTDRLDAEQKILDLRRKYMGKFLEILPVKKVAKLPAAERDFKRRIIQRMREGRKNGRDSNSRFRN